MINKHISPPKPVVIEHTIKLDGPTKKSVFETSVYIESDLARLKSDLTFPPEGLAKVKELNVEIRRRIQQLNSCKSKRDFFKAFLDDPANLVKSWLDSQCRDLEIIMAENTDGVSLLDKQRSAYFKQDWVREAVFHYLSKQTAHEMQKLFYSEQQQKMR